MVTGQDQIISIEISDSDLRERNRSLTILLEMSRFLSSTMSLEDLLPGVLARVMDSFEFQTGRLYMLEPDGSGLRLAAYLGEDSSGLEAVALGEGFTGRAAETRSFVAQYVTELPDEERVQLLSEKGFRVVVCVPMVVADRLVGVLNLAATHRIALKAKEVELLLALGNQIAVAVDLVRVYQDQQRRSQALEEQSKTIEMFAYTIAHDLKSPAVSIHGLTNLLRSRFSPCLDEKGLAYCNQILKASEQMLSLLGEISAYAGARESPLMLEPVSMQEVFESIRHEFAGPLRDRKVSLIQSEPAPVVMADRLSIVRILRNLVDNALKYGGGGLTTIRLQFRQDEDFYTLCVSDDGVGIPKAGADDVFKPFHRLETSRGTGGTGLGLAIVKELAERHGGTLVLDSTCGRGTAFQVTLSKRLQATT